MEQKTTNDINRGHAIAALIVILAVGAILRIPTFSELCCNPDLAGIRYSAEGLLDGFLPYVDSVESKPPGAYFLTALIFAVLGRSFLTIYILSILWHSGVAVTLYLAGRQLSDRKTGLFSALLYALFSTLSFMDGLCPNYETWALLPLSLSLLFGIRALKEKSLWLALVAGICGSLAFQIKLQTIFPSLCLAAVLIVSVFSDRAHGAKNSIIFAAGWITGLVPLILYYQIQGKLGWLISNFLPSRATQYAQSNQFVFIADALPGMILSFLLAAWPVLLAGCIGLIFLVFQFRKSSELQDRLSLALIILWFLGCTFSVVFLKGLFSSALFAEHYFMLVVPAFALIGGIGWRKADELFGNRAWRLVVTIVFLAILTFHMRDGFGKSKDAIAELMHSRNTEETFINIVSRTRLDHLSLRPLGHFLRNNTNPDDAIYVWDYAPEVYVYANRRAPGRHYKYWEVVTHDPWGHYFDADHPVVKQSRKELISDLKRKPPKYIVVFRYYVDYPQSVPTLKVDFFVELSRFVEDNYVPLTLAPPEWQMLKVYELKQPKEVP